MINPPKGQKITETLQENYMPYAMSVIISRAIPEIDGFKPSHRKLLYTMYKMGLLNGAKTKSANIVGQTMKLNPHGDMAIYETMVRMTRGNGALLHPFVDSKGNFGKQYSRDMAFAASRYTEAKLDDFCREMFGDIDKNTVDFQDNYDGTMKEPTMLPVSFPSILVNSNQGIAVGMASNICSFNLRELCETTIEFIKHPSCDISETLIAPDFPSGGYIIYKRDELKEIYKTGRGGFRLRSKYRYDKKNNCIEIFEIPYTTTCEAIIDKLVDLIKTNKVREITDIRDETDLGGLKIAIDIKKGVDADKLMARLYQLSPLEEAFNCNFNILINGKPRVMGVSEILHEWTIFRSNCIKRRLLYDITKSKEKLHLLLGLKKILLDIDKAIKIVRETNEDEMVIPNLMKGFLIDNLQAEFVAEIKLRNLNKQYIIRRTAETDELANKINELEYILSEDKEVKKLVIEGIKDVSKKYGKDRITEILEESDIEEYHEEQFIEDYNLKVFLTKENYLKKISLVSLRSASEQKLKEGDSIIYEYEATNHHEILFFSNMQNCYKSKLYEIGDCKASSWGEYLPNILDMQENEEIIYMIPTTDEYVGNILFGFENGKVAKVPFDSYATKQNRKKLTKAYSEKSPAVGIVYTTEDTDIAVSCSSGKYLVFSSMDIPLKVTRSAQGVQTMRLKKGSIMDGMINASALKSSDPKSYKARNLPSGGYYPKGDDDPQVSIFK